MIITQKLGSVEGGRSGHQQQCDRPHFPMTHFTPLITSSRLRRCLATTLRIMFFPPGTEHSPRHAATGFNGFIDKQKSTDALLRTDRFNFSFLFAVFTRVLPFFTTHAEHSDSSYAKQCKARWFRNGYAVLQIVKRVKRGRTDTAGGILCRS